MRRRMRQPGNRWGATAASLLLLFFTGTATAVARNSMGIEVRARPDGEPVNDLVLTVRPSDTTATRQLFLVQSGDQAIEDLRLVAVLDGPASITITPLGGGAGDTLTVPAGGRPALFTLQATMSAAGTSSGDLLAGEAMERLVGLRVERNAPAALVVQGADDTTGLALKSETASFRQTLQVVSMGEGRTEARLGLSLFTDPTGAQTPATVEVAGASSAGPAAFEVPGLASVPVTISLPTPLAGDYTGELSLVFDDQRKGVPVKITRTRVAPTVAFESIPQRRATISILGSGNIDTRVSMRETSGTATALDGLTVEVVEVDGAVEVQTDLGPALVLADGQPARLPLVFEGGEVKGLAVRVSKLPGPGHYRAKLRASAAKSSPVEQTFDLSVRYPLWVALGVIFLTVIVSHFLRSYFSRDRQRLLDQQQIATYLERLETFADDVIPTDDAESRVVEQLRRHLEQHYRRSGSLPPVDLSVHLELVRLKLNRILGRWVDARRRAVRAGAPALNEKLRPVQRFLMQSVPEGEKTPEQSTEKQEAVLNEVETELDQEHGLPARIERFLQAVASREKAQPGRYAGVRRTLAEAERDDLDESTRERAYREAAGQWAKQLAAELESRVPATSPPPLGLEAGDWSERRNGILEQVSAAKRGFPAEKALEAYESGVTLLLSSLVEGLTKRISERKASVEGMSNYAQKPDLQEAAATLDKLATRLATSKGLLDSGAWEEAEAIYNPVIDEYKTLMAKIGLPMSHRGESDPAKVELPVSGSRLVGAGSRQERRIEVPESAALGRRVRRFELVTTVVVLIVASLLGVQVLYADDATWGRGSDLIVAILWGLGLHAVGNQTFGGTDWIRQQFGLAATK